MAEARPFRVPSLFTGGAGLALLSVLLFLPCLLKPPHIDEESYLFIARAIEGHLGHPYDWWRPWQPFTGPAEDSFIYAHPPLLLWWLSAAGQALGFDQVVWLRLAQLPFAAAMGWALWRLARELTHAPPQSAALLLLAPATALVLQQSLMIDLMAWSLGLLGLAVMLPRLLGRDQGHEALGALLWAAGCLTKYPVLLLGGVMVMLSLCGGRAGRRALWVGLGVGLAPQLLWQLLSAWLYGTPHLLFVLAHAGEIARSPLASRTLGALSHLPLSALGLPLCLALLGPPRGRAWLNLVVAVGVLAALVWARGAPPDLGGLGALGTALDDASGPLPPAPGARALLAAAWAVGLAVVGALASSLLRRGEPIERALAASALLLLGGVVLSHNFIGGRYLLPAGVMAGLLLWRRSERLWGLATTRRRALVAAVPSVALMAAVATADLVWARAYPALVDQVEAQLPPGATVWFTGEWGLRYQAERRGWRPLGSGEAHPGDVVVLPHMAAPWPAEGPTHLLWEGTGPSFPLKTQDPTAGIGFYSEVFGYLPFGISAGPVERLTLLRLEP